MPAPADHAGLTAAFHRAIAVGDLPPGVTARDPTEAEVRFSVYRNNVMHSLVQALRARFPVVERLVGQAFFTAMAKEFATFHPPDTPVLQVYGARFPAFLAAFPPVAALPYLPDVARLEIARGTAYHAAEASPVSTQALLAASGADMTVRLHPSVGLVASAWPVWSIWHANQPGGDGQVTGGGPQAVLIWRDPTQDVQTAPLGPDVHRFLAAMMRGETLGVAVGAAGDGFDPTPALTQLISAGLVIAVARHAI